MRLRLAWASTLASFVMVACDTDPEPVAPTSDWVGGEAVAAPPATGTGEPIDRPPADEAETDASLHALAVQHLPGSHAEGPALHVALHEGETGERPFRIEPGRCYSALATGTGITEIDVQFVTSGAAALPSMTLAQDQSTGPEAILGTGDGCFRSPVPIATDAKLVVRATAGSGQAVAQVFSK